MKKMDKNPLNNTSTKKEKPHIPNQYAHFKNLYHSPLKYKRFSLFNNGPKSTKVLKRT